MSVLEILGTALLSFAVLVYVVVLAMCRAAGRADRSLKKSLTDTSDMIIDFDGIARGITPPAGVKVPPVPTPRTGVPAVPGASFDPRDLRRNPD